MNCILSLSRRSNQLNKLFLLNKFDVNFDSFNHKLRANQLISRTFTKFNSLSDTEELEHRLIGLKGLKEESRARSIKQMIFDYTKKYDYFNRQNPRNEDVVSLVKRIGKELTANRDLESDQVNSLLMEFYTDCGQLESALDMKNRISLSFRLDSFKLFNLAALLVANDKTNAAINLIESELTRNKSGRGYRDNREDFIRRRDQSINRLLNALIDKRSDVELIRRVFKICAQISPTKVNKTIAGPLIKMHLVNKDLSSALNEYMWCAHNYGVIPWTIEMMRIFIEAKDQKSLEIVVKTATKTHGPYTTALDLSAAYVYHGLEDMAKLELSKISRIQQKSVEMVCDKFVRDHKFDELKTYILLIQSIDGIDRQQLFSILINGYKRSGQTDKALDVLNLMKQQNIEPSESTLKLYDKQ